MKWRKVKKAEKRYDREEKRRIEKNMTETLEAIERAVRIYGLEEDTEEKKAEEKKRADAYWAWAKEKLERGEPI